MNNIKKLLAISGVSLIIIIAFLKFAGAFLFGPKNSISSMPNIKKIQVTASFYPLYFFASVIGGDRAEVRNITPAGAEPHDYEPTTADIVRIEKSDMLILNGGSFEAWGEKIKKNIQGTNVAVVIAGEGLLTGQISNGENSIVDTHIWLSPRIAKQEVSNITQGYIKIDPDHNYYYLSNENSLDDKLDKLNRDYEQGLSNCKQKDIITSHAAFGYLAGAYKFNQVPISGLSPDSEPSSRQLVEVVKIAKAQKANYIFFEGLVNPKLSEMIANEIGAKTLVLDPLEGLPDDKIKEGKDYFTVMEDNLKNLKLALQCGN
jgi:zinc transport system substrate-binding protein